MFSCSFVDRNSLLVSEFGFRVACKLFSRKSVFLVAAAGVFRPPRRFSLNLLIGFRQTIFIRSTAAQLGKETVVSNSRRYVFVFVVFFEQNEQAR